MWLLPVFSLVSRVAARVYYRLSVTGARVPRDGPVLLVANHPNSLLDPVLVAGTARRRVRFLAKAPLFTDAKVGWLVRGSGSIPVYRQRDDPEMMGRNVDMFRAVYDALADGAAVGIFPEGITHGEPSMTPLKTGAARIALGAFPTVRRAFPIVPVGLVFRQKDVFRSAAAVIVGSPVEWDDLAPRGIDDPEAVRALTDRIAAALRQVTVNLDRWADRPLAECAVRIWEAESGAAPDRAARVARLETTTSLLARVRSDPTGRWDDLLRDVAAFCRRLGRLRLRPADLTADVSIKRGFRWGLPRIGLVMLPATITAVVTFLLFWPPWRATGIIVGAMRTDHETRSTHKLLVGIVLYALWLLLVAGGVGVAAGPAAGAAVLLAMPLAGMVGLAIRERWRGAWSDGRRFFLLRSRRALVRALRDRQASLAARMRDLYDEMAGEGTTT